MAAPTLFLRLQDWFQVAYLSSLFASIKDKQKVDIGRFERKNQQEIQRGTILCANSIEKIIDWCYTY